MKEINLPVDCDLSVSSLHWAFTLAGLPDSFTLIVHPYAKQYAEMILYYCFGPYWRDRPVVVEISENVGEDGWDLVTEKVKIHTSGG